MTRSEDEEVAIEKEAKARKRVREKARKAKAVKTIKPWDELIVRIQAYAEARVADSWKGGSDPMDIPIFEAQLALETAKLMAHIEYMKRELA